MDYKQLHKLFKYQQGKLLWRIPRGPRSAGDEAGCVFANHRMQYRKVGIDGKTYRIHRIIWFMHYGKWPEGEIDHIDGNGLNNKLRNLREVRHIDNQKNRSRQLNNTSGMGGIYLNKKLRKWVVRVCRNSKWNHVGVYDDILDAIAARKKALRRHHYHKNHDRRIIP